jgi:hypothetical protein
MSPPKREQPYDDREIAWAQVEAALAEVAASTGRLREAVLRYGLESVLWGLKEVESRVGAGRSTTRSAAAGMVGLAVEGIRRELDECPECEHVHDRTLDVCGALVEAGETREDDELCVCPNPARRWKRDGAL